MGLLSALLGLIACDSQRISELEEGVATEADVLARFGEPEKVWDAPGGGKTLESWRVNSSPLAALHCKANDSEPYGVGGI